MGMIPFDGSIAKDCGTALQGVQGVQGYEGRCFGVW